MKSKKLASLTAILVALFFLVGFYPAETAAKEKHEEKFEKTVSLAKDGEVILKNISGGIEVKSWNKDQVKIDALKVSEASTLSQAKENSKKVEISVSKEGKILRIETKYPKKKKIWGNKSFSVSVHYRLWIPDKASAKIKSVSSGVVLEEIGSTVKVDAVSGDVEVRKAKKGVDCETVSGNMKLQDIVGDAYLKTVSGKITLEKMRGSIEAETVSGRIELREVSAAKVVKGKTVSGSIVYQGEINSEGRYSLKSLSGNIEMLLPSDSGFEFEAETFSGNIESDFQITISGKAKPREIQGVVNKGGALVKISTFSGSIHLKKT